jgi:hypothetical protein
LQQEDPILSSLVGIKSGRKLGRQDHHSVVSLPPRPKRLSLSSCLASVPNTTTTDDRSIASARTTGNSHSHNNSRQLQSLVGLTTLPSASSCSPDDRLQDDRSITSARTTDTKGQQQQRYRRRGSITKYSLDDATTSSLHERRDTPTSKEEEEEKTNTAASCASVGEEESRQQQHRRYTRRGSITKYSLDDCSATSSLAESNSRH